MGDSLDSCTLVRLEVGWPQTLWLTANGLKLLFVISLPFWGTTPGTPSRWFLEPDPKINHPSYSTSLLDFCELMVSGLPCLNTFRLAGPPLPTCRPSLQPGWCFHDNSLASLWGPVRPENWAGWRSFRLQDFQTSKGNKGVATYEPRLGPSDMLI